ncbi:MAG TPA: PQQ-binding-like beta-propeller repeat protein [Thermoanaerobaculia bacterium]|jgi:outer membrane protein assembly factor BamB
MKRRAKQWCVVAVAAMAALPLWAQGNSQTPGPPEFVSQLRHYPGVHDVSKPLREMKSSGHVTIQRIYGPLASVHATERATQTPQQPTTDSSEREIKAPQSGPRRFGGITTDSGPTWLNNTTYQGQGATFPGGGYVITGEPPDTEGAVGKNHFVQLVNSSMTVFDKTGNVLYGPVDINTLFDGFPTTDGNRCAKNNDGDPIVYYDQLADRWVLSQFDVSRPTGATSDYQCLAVSTSGDPLGTYYRWDYAIPGGMMGDYEKIGLWPDGYYMTIRAFTTAGAFQGAKVLIFDRAKLLIGAPDATQLDSGYLCEEATTVAPCGGNGKNATTPVDGFTPMSLDGFTAPPQAMPGAAAAYYRSVSGCCYSGWFLRFYWLKINSNADGSWPASPTLTVSAAQDVTVTQYSVPANVPQPGTTQRLDTLANNLMYRLAYRNYGTPAAPNDRLVVNHTVTDTTTTNSGSAAGIRWYLFDNPSNTTPKATLGTGTNLLPRIVLQETYAPDNKARWLGSIAMDKRQNIGIGYSIAGTVKPGMAVNGRQVGDNTTAPLLKGETIVQPGGGIKPATNPDGSAGNARWGDYSQTSIDPMDDCTFWHTNEHIASDGNFNWSTAFAAFRFPDCLTCTAPATPTGVTATKNSNTSYTVGWAASTGAGSYSVYRNTAACPQGTPVKIATCPGTAGCAANNLSYTDSSAVSGTSYWYSVSAIDSATGNCESIRSTCVSGTTGSCAQVPSFAGIESASEYSILPGGVIANNSCSIHLEWSEGLSNCPDQPAVVYNVYRGTTSTFTPAAANNIAKCLSTLTFDDNSTLTGGTTYYYKVRAEDSTTGNGGLCNGGNEDKNTVVQSASPGNFSSVYYENFDTTTAGSLPSGWTAAGQWRGAMNCAPAYSGSNVLHWGANTCGGQYSASANDDLTSPTINIPAGTTRARFSMWHRWNMAGTVRDGLHLRVSVNGAAAIEIPTAAFLNGGYTGTRLADNGDGCGTALPYANLGIWGGQQNTMKNTLVDLDQVCGGTCAGKSVKFYFTGLSNCTATNDLGWFIDDLQVLTSTSNTCNAPAATSQIMTVTSGNNQNTIEWVAGASGSRLHVRYRTDQFPNGINDGTAVAGSPFAITPGGKSSTTVTGLQNGTTYYYSAYTDTGAGTAVSNGRMIAARPQDTVNGQVKWIYNTTAASMTPPGVGSVYSVANDRFLHSMNAASGTWPTSPSTWLPFLMGGASQGRPAVPTVDISGTLRKVLYLGSQDGFVYCVNGDTGAQIWKANHPSQPASSMIQAAPVGEFTSYGGTYNLIFAATRNATADNMVYALNAATGAAAWSFNNGGGVNGIGIISGDPWVEFGGTTHKLYFTSRSKSGGSSGTIWCLDYTANSAAKCTGFPISAGDSDASITLYNGSILVGNNSGKVYSFNATTGAQNWVFDTADGPIKGFVNPDFANGSNDLYVATTNKVWAITNNGSSAAQHWVVGTIAFPSIPLLTGSGHLFTGSADGKLYQLTNLTAAAPTIKSLTLGTGDAAVGSPSFDYSTNQVYVGTDAGRIYAVVAPLP